MGAWATWKLRSRTDPVPKPCLWEENGPTGCGWDCIVRVLPTTCHALGLIPQHPIKPGMVVHPCHPGTGGGGRRIRNSKSFSAIRASFRPAWWREENESVHPKCLICNL